MADKIVLINAQKPITGNYTYQPKPAIADTPKLVVAKPTDTQVTTNIDTQLLVKVIVNNLGEEALPNPYLFKRAQDYYIPIDILAVTFISVKLEQVNLTDQFARAVQYNRIFQNSVLAAESYKITFGRNILESTQVTDTPQKSVQKIFFNTSAATDTPQITYGKGLFNQTTNSELIFADIYKVAAENAAISDTLTRIVDFKRSFAHIADATDDFYGLANADDDQIARVGKTLVTWLASTEVKSILMRVVKLDTASVLEQKQLWLNKPLINNVLQQEQTAALVGKSLLTDFTNSDISSRNVGKVLLNTQQLTEIRQSDVFKVLASLSNTADLAKFSTSKILQDSSSTSDVLSRYWQAQRVFADTAQFGTGVNVEVIEFYIARKVNDSTTVSSQTTLNTDKILSSAYSVPDVFNRKVDYIRLFTDSVATTDDFFGAANIDDDQTARIGKNVLTWLASVEQHSVFGSKVLNTQYFAVEQARLQLTKVLRNAFGNTDQLSYTANKLLNSAGVTQDSQVFNTTKPLSSGFVSTDDFSRTVVYNRQPTDLVIASDVSSSLANKALITQTTVGDFTTTQTDFKRILASAGITQDLQVFNTSKTLSSGFVSTDDFSRTIFYSRQLTDLVIASDVSSSLANKALITQTTVGDVTTTQTDFKRILNSIVSNTELVVSAVQAVKQDLIATPEQVRKRNTKVLATEFSQQDVLQKTPNKTLSSQSTTSDVFTFFKFGNRVFSEIATTNDSGVINNQSYFAESYVEPGYAGTNTNFS
jgi:hypothetical protein